MFQPFALIFSAAAVRLLVLRFLALCGLTLGLAAAAQARQPPEPPSQAPSPPPLQQPTQQPTQALPPEGTPQLDLPRLQLQAGLHLITVQVASTPAQLSTGLMWRRSMPANEGMWFVFNTPAIQCFWMKNTFLPLTAAFVADDGRIVNLADMQPLSERSHCSAAPVRFVLEMHQGWFAQRGIEAGQRLRGAPFAAAPSR